MNEMTDAVSGTAMMAHLREFARWVKLSGTPDELESLGYVRRTIAGFGYRTEIVKHDAYISLPGAAKVEVGNAVLTAITHSHARSGVVTGRVVDVGAGDAAGFAGKDVRGAIVLAEGIASPGVARLASEGGAVGQLHISPHEHLHEMCISPVWGSPSAETLGEMPSTVVCTISHADGMALRARTDAPRVVLHAEVDTGWRTTPILVAELGEADAPFVLFSGHHDTWYFGVMDNGSANATMLEVARLAAERRSHWKRGLRICFWSGHSHGRYSGSAWYVDQHWDELERRCVAHVNVDSTGGVGATVLENAASAAELGPLAAEALRLHAGSGFIGKRKARSSDDSFPGIGIPAMFGALSEQPPGTVKMRNSLGWWWHTPHDTIDKLDAANLVRDTKVFAHVLSRLLEDDVLPIDYGAHARALRAELEKIDALLGARFAVDGLLRQASDLERAAAAVSGEPARVNKAIMLASRALVPMDYTRGDRFVHDPALPLPAWPVLQPLRALAATAPGSEAERFARVDAVRARNRVAYGIRQATEGYQEAK